MVCAVSELACQSDDDVPSLHAVQAFSVRESAALLRSPTRTMQVATALRMRAVKP